MNPAAFFVDAPESDGWPPWAKSVLLMAFPYAFFGEWPEGHAEVSAYYFLSHLAHNTMLGIAENLQQQQGVRTDTRQNLHLKPLGQSIGLGVIGRNGLLRNALWGSRFGMQMIWTDIPPSSPHDMSQYQTSGCGDCRLCEDACPTGAIGDTFTSDRCLRWHMFSGEVVPEEFRAAMGNKLIGCDICQKVCPNNQGGPEIAPAVTEPFLHGLLLRSEKTVLDVIALALGKNYARDERVLAQAAIVAGNSGDPKLLPLLAALDEHPSEAVREHARWAHEVLRRERWGTVT